MFEVANALLILHRRRRIEEHEYEQARLDLTDASRDSALNKAAKSAGVATLL
jgi:hypothetical protein